MKIEGYTAYREKTHTYAASYHQAIANKIQKVHPIKEYSSATYNREFIIQASRLTEHHHASREENLTICLPYVSESGVADRLTINYYNQQTSISIEIC